MAGVDASIVGVALVVNVASRSGCAAIYKDGYKDGLAFEVVVFDEAARARPDWAAAFRQRPLRVRPIANQRVEDRDWTDMVRRLGARLEPARRPHALAAILVRPVGS